MFWAYTYSLSLLQSKRIPYPHFFPLSYTLYSPYTIIHRPYTPFYTLLYPYIYTLLYYTLYGYYIPLYPPPPSPLLYSIPYGVGNGGDKSGRERKAHSIEKPYSTYRKDIDSLYRTILSYIEAYNHILTPHPFPSPLTSPL